MSEKLKFMEDSGFLEESRKVKKKFYVVFAMNVVGLFGEISKLLDQFSDVVLLNNTYWISMAFPKLFDYKIAVVFMFMSIMSTYLILTST